MVDIEEESKAVRADLGRDGGFEGGAVGDVEERGEVDGGNQGVETGEDCGVRGCGGGCEANAAVGL